MFILADTYGDLLFPESSIELSKFSYLKMIWFLWLDLKEAQTITTSNVDKGSFQLLWLRWLLNSKIKF